MGIPPCCYSRAVVRRDASTSTGYCVLRMMSMEQRTAEHQRADSHTAILESAPTADVAVVLLLFFFS